jgi:8-oxo-dGTP diphosphatase
MLKPEHQLNIANLADHRKFELMIEVVCGVIYNEHGQILICRRAQHKSLAGYWEFPGGKVESEELPEQSLSRELQEELGMEVLVQDFLIEVMHKYDDFAIKLLAYRCGFISASYRLSDHDQYKWVYPQELVNFELAAADIPIAEFLYAI